MSTFFREMAKQAYSASAHKQLMESSIDEAFPEGVGKPARKMLIRGSIEADLGLRHPWLPWNDTQHAFPSSTKKEIGREIGIVRDKAIKNLSTAVAGADLGKMRRNTLMTQSLLGLGHAQHAQMDVGSHHVKPLEMARKSGDEKQLKKIKLLRSRVFKLPGQYGGIVPAGEEHRMAGLGKPGGLGRLSSQLDRLQPTEYKSDKATVSNARVFGKSLRSATVRQISKDHGIDGRDAEELLSKRLKEFKPSTAENVAGTLLDSGKYGIQQVQRAKRIPETLTSRSRAIYGAAKSMLRGIVGG